MTTPGEEGNPLSRVVRSLQASEDLIYIAVGIALILAAAVLLVTSFMAFLNAVRTDLHGGVLRMLDNLLLVLMLVEILHTVGTSLREHILVIEPFLIVGLIAVIRRVLVITAELSRFVATDPLIFQRLIVELGLLALLILILVISIYLIRRRENQHGKTAL